MSKVKKKPETSTVISDRLHSLLDSHDKMPQRVLAEKIGIPTMVLNRTINNTACPNADAIVKMARYFGVSTDYLLGLEKKSRGKRRASA